MTIRSPRFFKLFVRKTPDAVRSIGVDWSRFVRGLGSGVAVSSVSWSANSSDITLSGAALASNVATIKVSGGTQGNTYLITCQATCDDSAGTVEEKTGRVEVVEYKGMHE